VFGAIINRDECFSRIVEHGARLRLPWATEHATHSDVAQTAEPNITDTSTPSSAAAAEKSPRTSNRVDTVDRLDEIDDNFCLFTS
jgi:hypothetical protein